MLYVLTVLQFTVTVPEGGVKSGQVFQVDTALVAASNTETPPHGPRWKHTLCSCCETCCCPFWMGWCCLGIFAGQVFQRMKYNIVGCETSNASNTCVIMTVISLTAWLVTVILSYLFCDAYTATYGTYGFGTITYYFISYAFLIYIVVALTFARNNMRKKYNIQGSCCEGCLDDCCCAYWCSCCTLIQMHRETHDENQYRYDIGSKTGLQRGAPEVV